VTQSSGEIIRYRLNYSEPQNRTEPAKEDLVNETQTRNLLTGAAAGLLAGFVVGKVDRLADRLVSEQQKRLEKQVREDSAHKMAGPYFARKILGHELSPKAKRMSRAAFGVTYGLMWGLIYAGLREKFPNVRKYMGLPFAVPFFFGCDGVIAPLLGVSPGIRKIPWQINTKEMVNHIAWTMTAETVYRFLSRDSGETPASNAV
jgi:putative membrane protein